MPFAATTAARIALALELPIAAPAWQESVERSLLDAFNYGGETVVTQVEGWLTQLEQAQTALNADAANAGLIQADVLRWESGQKASGYRSEITRLRRQIARVLMIEYLLPNGGNSNRIEIGRG